MERKFARRMGRASLWAGVVFVLAFLGIGFVTFSGHAGWFHTRNSLQSLRPWVRFVENDGWSVAEVAKVNEVLALPDEVDRRPGSIPGVGEYDWLDDLRRTADEGRLQSVFGTPVRFVVGEDLPEGVGFYLSGEDGFSVSGGDDVDDVNSWEPDSGEFYERRQSRAWLRGRAWRAAIPTAMAWAWVFWWPGRPEKVDTEDAKRFRRAVGELRRG